MSVHVSNGGQYSSESPRNRLGAIATWLLIGVPLGLAWFIIWPGIVKTSPTTADEERVRGWASVVRELPATVPFILVPLVGMLLGALAARSGSVSRGVRALRLHAVAMVGVLLIVLGGSADNVMTTRSATVKWLLFPFEIGLPLALYLVARSSVAKTKGP